MELESSEMEKKKKHFVLVHGACLGAWTWYKVAARLKSGGSGGGDCKVTALDMAACGINPRSVEDIHSMEDYSEPLMEFMEGLPEGERVILVGHSMGGASISLAMEKFPLKIAVAVFLAADMPCLGIDMKPIYEKYKRSVDFYMDSKFVSGKDGKGGSFLFGPKYMSTKIFQLCPPEDLELALALIRPTPGSVDEDVSNALTQENYGSVPRVYIKAEDDMLINRPIENFRIENYPPQELKIIHNADHMAMLSNPNDLSSYLLQISLKYM
ncbi:hypothetical protein M9H77_34093 [Catharanthus roseus]|uniref:Uncharacterized protein n=1 Tax=Catharanthus roseus TaxID=4058 RepID=A0ACB9ZKX3_CATRO|nr:hypothetical protein M9H77_34093 [Catharanthus roseus]